MLNYVILRKTKNDLLINISLSHPKPFSSCGACQFYIEQNYRLISACNKRMVSYGFELCDGW